MKKWKIALLVVFLIIIVVGVGCTFLVYDVEITPAAEHMKNAYEKADFVVTNRAYGFDLSKDEFALEAYELRGELLAAKLRLFNAFTVSKEFPLIARNHLRVVPSQEFYVGDEVGTDDFDAYVVYDDGYEVPTVINSLESSQSAMAYVESSLLFNTEDGSYEADVDVIEPETFVANIAEDIYLVAGELCALPADFSATLTYVNGEVRTFLADDLNISWQTETLQDGDNPFIMTWHNIVGDGIVKAMGKPIIQSDEYPMYYRDLHTTITITKERYADSDVFVAHVLTDDPLALKATFGEGGYNSHQVMSEVMAWRNAVLMINGDFGDAGNGGMIPIVRDGEIVRLVNPPIRGKRTIGITREGHFYEVKGGLYWEIETNHLRDCWTFNSGFTIINGERIIKYDGAKHPRTFIGEVLRDDGLLEYYLCVVDGRREGSRGFCHDDESAFLFEKGCSIAYNLDGGGSSEMMFDGKILNTPSDGHERRDHDFIYFAMWDGIDEQ